MTLKMVSPGGVLPTGAVVCYSFGKRTCKPNSVVCGHSSRRRVAADAHQRPTRRFWRLLEPPGRIGPMRNASLALGSHFPPYLVLLRVGFTMPPALQPKRCALTAPFHPYPGARLGRQINSGGPAQGRPHNEGWPRRYLFCGTGRPCAFKHTSRTLSGTLPCGVRTFLPRRSANADPGSDRPVLLPALSVSRIANRLWPIAPRLFCLYMNLL